MLYLSEFHMLEFFIVHDDWVEVVWVRSNVLLLFECFRLLNEHCHMVFSFEVLNVVLLTAFLFHLFCLWRFKDNSGNWSRLVGYMILVMVMLLVGHVWLNNLIFEALVIWIWEILVHEFLCSFNSQDYLICFSTFVRSAFWMDLAYFNKLYGDHSSCSQNTCEMR